MRLRNYFILAAVPTLACGSDSAGPVLAGMEDQKVGVGQKLELEIKGSNTDQSPITYGFSSNAPGDDSAQLTFRPDGTGLFSWTPAAKDVGTWIFDFSAIDENGRTTESIVVDVRSALGQASVPIFRRPLGSGTAIRMTSGTCVDLEIEATDQDSLEVEFSQEEPIIAGAELVRDSEFSAIWHWCPTDTQWRAQDRYLVTLAVDDKENPRAIKRYQIILRDNAKSECSGQAPTITHISGDQSTLNNLVFDAVIHDESGLKAAPLLYHSTEPPSDPPDLTKMTQEAMTLKDGDSQNGTWTAQVTNPLLDGISLTSVYYVIVAEDNDDSGGACDHVQAESYAIRVTRPEQNQGLGLCEPCSADGQCGGENDNCLASGSEGAAFCFTACGSDDSCPEGYVCSNQDLTSVNDAVARQCIPTDEQCLAPNNCADDSYEQNDGMSQAKPLDVGTTLALRMCPVAAFAGDEDWYSFEVTEDSDVVVALQGEVYPNVDLALLDASGKLLAMSEDWGSTDDLNRCLVPGTYYVRAYSYFGGENNYSLSMGRSSATCDTTSLVCEDDAFEDDDTLAESRKPDFEDGVQNWGDNQICAGDDDVFFISLFGGETVYTSLTFEQQAPTQDLELRVMDSTGLLLTPCTEDMDELDLYQGCDPSNGQSTDSNEYMAFTAPEEGGEFYIVVHGWADSENTYQLCMSLDPTLCPVSTEEDL